MRNRYHLMLLSLLIFLSCCKRDNSSPKVFTKESYPIAVGNWWQYQLRYCSTTQGITDTITLSVVSMSTAGPYTNYKCYFTYNGTVTDSAYFQQSDTSLSFVNISSYAYFSAIPNFHIKFPASAGQYWNGAFPGDSTLVVGVANSCNGSNGHSFSPCFSTNEAYNVPHNFLVNSMLLTPQVGLISQSVDFKSDTAGGGFGAIICQSVKLINYSVQ